MVGGGSSLCNERELFMIFTTTLLQSTGQTTLLQPKEKSEAQWENGF